jgi:endonuclease YncB( thermonuclease family)
LIFGDTELRLGGFDAPERDEPGGREATEALRSIAFGETVICTQCEGARISGRCTS